MMQRYKLRHNLALFICFFLFTLFFPKKLLAATLSLDPASSQVAVNTHFTVKINLDTKGEKTTAVDAVLTYNPSLMEVVNVEYATPLLYPTNTKIIDNVNGKVRMTSTMEDAVTSYNGQALWATLTINPKALGTASLVFTCDTGKTNDSNVFKKGTSQDILECTNLTNGTYVISTTTGSVSLTATPKPTLPTSGNFGPTSIFVIGGAALLGVGALLLLLL